MLVPAQFQLDIGTIWSWKLYEVAFDFFDSELVKIVAFHRLPFAKYVLYEHYFLILCQFVSFCVNFSILSNIINVHLWAISDSLLSSFYIQFSLDIFLFFITSLPFLPYGIDLLLFSLSSNISSVSRLSVYCQDIGRSLLFWIPFLSSKMPNLQIFIVELHGYQNSYK